MGFKTKKAHSAIGIGLDIVHKKPYSSHSFIEADNENDEYRFLGLDSRCEFTNVNGPTQAYFINGLKFLVLRLENAS